MTATYRRTHSPSRLVCLRIGGRLALSLYSSYEPSDDSSVTLFRPINGYEREELFWRITAIIASYPSNNSRRYKTETWVSSIYSPSTMSQTQGWKYKYKQTNKQQHLTVITSETADELRRPSEFQSHQETTFHVERLCTSSTCAQSNQISSKPHLLAINL